MPLPLPWEPNGVLGVAQLVQNLYVDKFPFGYTFPYKLSFEKGMFYAILEHRKYVMLHKFIPLLCLFAISITCGIGSLMFIQISTSWISVFKSIRFWLWSGMSFGSLILAAMH